MVHIRGRCGGPGMGKSMRAKRLQQILCKGWVANSGSASAKAGMNGGMDHLCGRLVYYDEVTTDFGSSDSDRIEYLKTITMEQHADLQRTVKTMGTNGLESFTTIHLETLHFESHMMSTNCGPLGIKSDTEPGTNRAALSDRSIAHVVHAASDEKIKSDGEFNLESASETVKEQINRLRVVSCIMAYVLVFIKHLPHCQPNITYARELTNKWDDIQSDEFNLPKPSRRKKLKRKMMFHVFAAESATVEKFLWKHTAVDFKDMLPDANGNLSGFCIDQLVDVIRSLQRCLDHETILNAWSHNLDHSAATSAHVFQMKTVLSQLHGADLDFRTLCGKMPPQPEDAHSRAGGRTAAQTAAGGAHQGVAPAEPDGDDNQTARPSKRAKTAANTGGSSSTPKDGADADDAFDAALGAGVPQPQTRQQAAPEAAATPAEPTAPEGDAQSTHSNDENETLIGDQEEEDDSEIELEPPTDKYGNPVCDRVQTKGLMQNGMTRRDCGRLSEQLETHRQLRADYSNRLAKRGVSAITPSRDPNRTALDTVTDAMTDAKTKRGKAVHLHASTGKRREAKRAAAAILPTTQDVLASGIDDQFLKDILQGGSSAEFGRPEWHHLLGLKRNLPWDYELLNNHTRAEARENNNNAAAGGGGGADGTAPAQSNRLLGPAEYDFNWAQHKSFTKNRSDSAASSGQKRKTTWTHATRVVKAASANARSNFFSLMHLESMTFESMRDTLFMMAQPAPENQVRIPTFSHQQSTILNDRKMLHNSQKILETALPTEVHPYGMFKECDPQTGRWELNDDFKNPDNMARPFDNSIVGDSGYQKRLDHLNKLLALPVVATPVSFSRGVPIKESEQGGILFNKWIAREHANLVVEAGVFLSRQPGVAGGDCRHIPDTFREPSALQKRRREKQQPVVVVEAEHDDEQLRADDFPALFPTDDTDDRDNLPPETGQVPPTAEEHTAGGAGGAASSSDQPTAADAARVDTTTGQAASDVRPAVDRVSTPHQKTKAPKHARAGAAKVAAAMSVDDDARVNALPYEWDMLQLFLTYKMAHTLHHDVKDYVKNMRREFGQVFGKETEETTLRDLPQMVLRFPGLCDRDAVLQPLSVKLSLDQPEGRYEDLGTKHKPTTIECSDLTKSTIHSISNGRQVKHDDPEVLAFEAEQRGLENTSTLKGNLFSRSAWLRFTLAQLDRRGMLTEKERERVHDQGICLRQRVIHEASCAGTKMKEWLGQQEPLPCGSFEARERIKRETGVDDRAGSKRLREQVEEDEDDVLGLARPFKKPECAGAFGLA